MGSKKREEVDNNTLIESTVVSDEIMVSVFCLAYNHERFIRKTLDGFIMQRTSFPFEVLIHDDASTDKTAEVIREYEEKYPDIIKPVYQKENQYSKPGHPNIIATHLFPRAKGKYFAWCEGDDYWIDPFKLQRQIDIMESHPECSACLSKVERITYEGKPKGEFIPVFNKEDGVIHGKDFVNYVLDPAPMNVFPIQISGLVAQKTVYCEYCNKLPSFVNCSPVGDIPLALYLGMKGDIYYIHDVMSHYRTGNPYSFIGRTHSKREKSAQHYERKAIFYESFDQYTNYEYHEHAEKAVAYCKYSAALKRRDYKQIRAKESRWLYRALPMKKKTSQFVVHYFPWAEEPLKKMIYFSKKVHRFI